MAFTVSSLQAAESYRRVLPDGTVEFSDQPGDDAQRYEIKEPTTYSPDARSAKRVPESSKEADETKDAKGEEEFTGYERFTIVQPQSDQTVTYNPNGINISVSLQPQLQPGHKVRYFVDGSQVAESSSLSAQTGNLYRGSHQVRAEVVDSNGASLKSTPNITFFVFQRSILNE